MTNLAVYDPPMCCSTGICGAQVDQRLVDLAADLDWLRSKGVAVRRINLSQEPAEFAANAAIRDLMQASEGDDLPAILVDGALVSKARYPSRAELAGWVGLPAPEPGIGGMDASTCCGAAQDKPAAATGCCGGGAKSGPETQGAGNCC
ncbi:arsenite efflux transporter metallochaperone ArsD [Paracoccaceae bacterium Fryx2]|nr:arsenite efflux transporter metallochaperone ArsD [Paracoccaceae bacterium Fryx2]